MKNKKYQEPMKKCESREPEGGRDSRALAPRPNLIGSHRHKTFTAHSRIE